MAKRKRPRGERPKRRGRPERPPASSPDLPPLPDRRALEASMWEIQRGLTGAAADTPQAKVQALMHQAFAERAPERRIALARQALDIDPDCADAYVLLAEHSRSPKEGLALYEQGVAAGERALGEEGFRTAAGHFWGTLETRPYMRARQGLAMALWTAARRDEAVRHLQEMLQLNPNDNQGLRFALAGFLLYLDRNDELARLLDQYPDDVSAEFAYDRALLAFRREGDTPASRRLLQAALKRNRHVPDYFLGRKFPPAERPGSYTLGGESEALQYVGSALASWKATAGAIPWLRAVGAARKAKAAPRPHGPLPLVKNWLKKNLPQEEDVWQANARRLPIGMDSDRGPVRPWVALVVNQADGLVLTHHVGEERPDAAGLWDHVVQAMRNPLGGQPHRPAELRVHLDERWESLRPHLEEVGVRLTAADSLDGVDEAYTSLATHMADGEPLPGLLDAAGVTPELAADCYRAAAAFFREMPWRRVGYESPIEVDCPQFRGGPWYAVLMGQSGMTMGVAFYEDLGVLRRMWAGAGGDEENARRTQSLTVIFGDEVGIPVGDLEAAERYGWEVARPDAYPDVFRKERGFSRRPPLPWELQLLTACLRALPDFVKAHKQDEPTPARVTVPTAAAAVDLTLSWVADEGPTG